MSAASVASSPPDFVTALRAGLSIASARLRTRAFAMSLGLAFALALAATFVQRRVGSSGAVDRSLGTIFTWIIPLSSFATVSAVIGSRSLKDAVWPVARFGLPRQSVAVAVTLANAFACAVVAVLLAWVALVFAHTSSSVPLGSDLFTTGWIALFTGVSYGAWFSLGAAFGRRGGGRGIVLALDFVLGKLGLFGVVFPRGNAENLLGFDAPLHVSQPASSALLIGVSLIVTGLVYLKTRD